MFGLKVDAKNGLDTSAGDILEPSSPMRGIVVYFWYPDNSTSPIDFRKFSTTFLHNDYPANWMFQVRTISNNRRRWILDSITTIPPYSFLHFHVPFFVFSVTLMIEERCGRDFGRLRLLDQSTVEARTKKRGVIRPGRCHPQP